MDRDTAQQLSSLTGDFYRRVGESFSRTRGSAWPGWTCILDFLHPDQDGRMEVLDLACGNLRFERELFKRVPAAQAWAVDSCDGLAQMDDVRIRYQHLDLAELLLEEGVALASLEAPPCDAAVCLAFMHHLPLPEQRARLLELLVRMVRPDGIVAVSFWQFAHDERLLGKARAATEAARMRYDLSGLGSDDYLMGWQDEGDAFRFCHHFPDSEIDALLKDVASYARVMDRYRADGASGDLNQYAVLEVR